jgi:hypothetical protein
VRLAEQGAQAIPESLFFADDLVRARSRAVSYALERKAWDWVLWWDDDVAPQDVSIVQRMVETAQRHGYDMLGAPYPRKRIPAKFPYKPIQQQSPIVNDCVEVDLLAFGFMLTSRHCLQYMSDSYDDIWFSDRHDDGPFRRIPALFSLVHGPEYVALNESGESVLLRDLYSEDYSFCRRWRDIGGKVHMYVGNHTPLAHIGSCAYLGSKAELGNV